MASHHYYNSYDTSNPYDQHEDTSYHASTRPQKDAPLPALPTSSPYQPSPLLTPAQSASSPFTTPFDDNERSYPAYNDSTQNLNRPYSYADSPHHDPFADQNAIPLQAKSAKEPYATDETHSPTTAMANAERFGGAAHGMQNDLDSRKRSKWFRNIPYAVYLLSTVQIIVFIVEIVKNATLTGSPIEIHPVVNPMIGPSPYVLINMGACYVPCMRQYDVPGKPGRTVAQVSMQCPNATTADPQCSLAQLCGFGLDLTPQNGQQPQPNQWFRFITPIFLHGGLIHIAFNLLLQLTLGRDIERQIGTLRFLLVYFSAGIFGFVLGGNYMPNGIPSTGCSGALFGIIAIVLLDLIYTWKNRKNPGRELLFIGLAICVSFVIGLLPALDNFSHIGGFVAGITLGICLLHSPDALRERIGLDDPPYSSMGAQDQKNLTGLRTFIKRPVAFFTGRKPLWWAWWLLRAGALAAVFSAFIVLLNNFYLYRSTCSWCKYISCLPIKNWCEIGNLQFTEQAQKRSFQVFGLGQSPA